MFYFDRLKRCDYCGQVTEISGYVEHLLGECEANDQIPKPEIAKLKTEKGKSICPLCKKRVTATEEGWQQHLMTEGASACTANPRRQPFLKRGKFDIEVFTHFFYQHHFLVKDKPS